jgi:hypothetical protein
LKVTMFWPKQRSHSSNQAWNFLGSGFVRVD